MEMKTQKNFMRPILVAILTGAVLLLVFRIGSDLQSDPLFTDLRSFPLYAKNGFQPSYALLHEPSATDWDLVLPPHSGRMIMADLPEPDASIRYGRYSTAARDIEEATLFIPFRLEREAYEALREDASLFPSLYFVGIGENWEIFLNGYLLTRQVFLDDAGNITRFRSAYGASVPVSKEYLSEGDNALVLHILGARGSKWSGLRYASPYYLGRNPNIANEAKVIANVFICTVIFLIGLFHVLIYALRRTDHYSLPFALFTTVASIYYFITMPIIYSLIQDTAIIQRLDYSLLYLLAFVGTAFLETICMGRVVKTTMIYGVFGASLAIVHWFFPIWFAYGLLSIWQSVTVVFFVAQFIAYDLVWQIYKAAAKLSKEAGSGAGFWRSVYRYLMHTEYGNVYIMLLIIGLTVIIDIINVGAFGIYFQLSLYSLLGFAMSMAYVFARKHASRTEIDMIGDAAMQEQRLAAAAFSQEESQVAVLLLEGNTNREIQRKLHLTAEAVDRYEIEILRKLRLPGSADPDISHITKQYMLTRRETEMLRSLSLGQTNEEIAAELFLSVETVRAHVRHLLRKLPLDNRDEIADWLNTVAEETD